MLTFSASTLSIVDLELTYEGLKLPSFFLISSTISHLELTYEGLKFSATAGFATGSGKI